MRVGISSYRRERIEPGGLSGSLTGTNRHDNPAAPTKTKQTRTTPAARLASARQDAGNGLIAPFALNALQGAGGYHLLQRHDVLLMTPCNSASTQNIRA